MRKQMAWPRLRVKLNSADLICSHWPGGHNLASQQRPQWKEQLETTTTLLTIPTVCQDMCRPLPPGCGPAAVACKPTWCELSWLPKHSATANRQKRQSLTSPLTVPSNHSWTTAMATGYPGHQQTGGQGEWEEGEQLKTYASNADPGSVRKLTEQRWWRRH